MKPKSHSSSARGNRPLGSLLVLLFGVGLVGSASASALVQMDLRALTTGADRILVGTVEKTESHHLSPRSSYIVTDVTLRSEREVLGVPAGELFVVRHLGGEVGGVGQRVYGEASYRVGERVLLFAAKRQGSYYALGMAQGALHVYRDAAGVARVRTILAGAEMLGGAVGTPDGLSLDAALDHVRSFQGKR